MTRYVWQGKRTFTVLTIAMAAIAGCVGGSDDDFGPDDVPACTSANITAPAPASNGHVGSPIALTASAVCPQGVVAEFQFWVKSSITTTWTILPGYTLGTSSWTPASSGTWNVLAAARARGVSVAYQVLSSSISVMIAGNSNRAPVAIGDSITTTGNAAGAVDVLLNDSDADGDTFSVTSFTQPEYGVVGFDDGLATYTPAASFVGSDAFTYTITDVHGDTATAGVGVTVSAAVPGCTISIATTTASPTYGENIHFDATASCNTGSAEIQWYHKANSTWAIVQAYSASASLDIVASTVGADSYYAAARTQGTTNPVTNSSTLVVTVADNVPACTSVQMTQPAHNGTGNVGVAISLAASAVCPVSVTPEYQFWVKPTTTSSWTVLPAYTLTTGSWTPPSDGTWHIKAAARAVGAHVSYQVLSSAILTTIDP